MVRRLIIVAREEADLYDYIRLDHVGDERVEVVADRRVRERRVEAASHVPDRRRTERRRHDVRPLLCTQGWAEVSAPECR
jgi:hypothetical protein